MAAYYNENEPKAAAWLRELIAQGHIVFGDVDQRSIEDVKPNDLNGYTQCHFFAGIGGWAYALRLAGWPDDKPIWTGSCPCQPFSAAGKRGGAADQRHLWPAFAWLIGQCRPAIVFGEQVASKAGRQWLAGIRADLEAMEYAVGAADLCAAGLGAPHIRQRLWWVADAQLSERGQERFPRHAMARTNPLQRPGQKDTNGPSLFRSVGGLADTPGAERKTRQPNSLGIECKKANRQPAFSCSACRLANHAINGRRQECPNPNRRDARDRAQGLSAGHESGGGHQRSGTDHGGWTTVDWLYGRGGKWRPIEPGLEPLADGVSARVGRLRGYGNAIVPQVAAQFISAFMESVA